MKKNLVRGVGRDRELANGHPGDQQPSDLLNILFLNIEIKPTILNFNIS